MQSHEARPTVIRLAEALPGAEMVLPGDVPALIEAIGGLVVPGATDAPGISAADAVRLVDIFAQQAARMSGAAMTQVAGACAKLRAELLPYRESGLDIDGLVTHLLVMRMVGSNAAAIDAGRAARDDALAALADAMTRNELLAREAWTSGIGGALGQLLAWPATLPGPGLPAVRPEVARSVVWAMTREAVAQRDPDSMRAAAAFMQGLDRTRGLTTPTNDPSSADQSAQFSSHLSSAGSALARLADIVEAAAAGNMVGEPAATSPPAVDAGDWLDAGIEHGTACLIASSGGGAGAEAARFGAWAGTLVDAVMPTVRSGSAAAISRYRLSLGAVGALLSLVAAGFADPHDPARSHAEQRRSEVASLESSLFRANSTLAVIAEHWQAAADATTRAAGVLSPDDFAAVTIAGPAIVGTAPVVNGVRGGLVTFAHQQALLRQIADAVPDGVRTGQLDVTGLTAAFRAGLESCALIRAIVPASMSIHGAGLAELSHIMTRVHGSLHGLRRALSSPHIDRDRAASYFEHPATVGEAPPAAWISILTLGALDAACTGDLALFTGLVAGLPTPWRQDRGVMALAFNMAAEVITALTDLDAAIPLSQGMLTSLSRVLRARAREFDDPDEGVRRGGSSWPIPPQSGATSRSPWQHDDPAPEHRVPGRDSPVPAQRPDSAGRPQAPVEAGLRYEGELLSRRPAPPRQARALTPTGEVSATFLAYSTEM